MNRIRLFLGGALLVSVLVGAYALANAQALSGPITIHLAAENNSEQAGTATLTDLGGGKTRIDLEVTGQPAESSQPVQVHAGQCGPTLARLVHPLSNLENGKSTTTIDAPFNSLFTGDFAINAHQSEEEYNIYVLCGNLPAAAAYIAQATGTAAAAQALLTATAEVHPPLTVPLMAENNSGETGTATLTDLGNGQTRIEFDVAGQPAGSSHIMHLHVGQCGPTLGRLVFKLNDLENGKSTTTIDAPLGSLLTGNFGLNGHMSAEEYNIYVICGNIPSEGALPLPTPGGEQATVAAAVPTIAETAAVTLPTEAATTTPVAPTAAQTLAPATATEAAPSATVVPPSATSVPSTATVVPATATNVPATATSVPATATSIRATATSAPATATSVPATATSVPATATSIPATATSAPAMATSVPATATSVPATATSIRATATRAPATATSVPATATSVPATATSIRATATRAPATATSVPATATSAPATATTANTSAAAGATETTAEATAEATTEATTEATAEATTEATTEATAEATAEATVAAGSPTETAPATTAAETTTAGGAAETTETPGPTASVAAPTPAPGQPTPTGVPTTGMNPHTERYLYMQMFGILVLCAGLFLLQLKRQG